MSLHSERFFIPKNESEKGQGIPKLMTSAHKTLKQYNAPFPLAVNDGDGTGANDAVFCPPAPLFRSGGVMSKSSAFLFPFEVGVVGSLNIRRLVSPPASVSGESFSNDTVWVRGVDGPASGELEPS